MVTAIAIVRRDVYAITLLNDELIWPKRSPPTLVKVFFTLVALYLLLDVVSVFVEDAWVPVVFHHHELDVRVLVYLLVCQLYSLVFGEIEFIAAEVALLSRWLAGQP